MTHRLPASTVGLQFCPYEDVLGVGHGLGFESLIIPGKYNISYNVSFILFKTNNRNMIIYSMDCLDKILAQDRNKYQRLNV